MNTTPHIINLAIKCKTATGDGTKIVCMNDDYVVRISTEDCGTFSEAPVKKLIVRYNKEYYESDITETTDNGVTVLQAHLPPIEHKDFIDLGVCGKNTDNPDEIPKYTSTSARYECDKSILCGVVVKKTDPVLTALTITKNGKYNAIDYDSDGFYAVDVAVADNLTEERIVELSMASGHQIIEPSSPNRTMSKVTVSKPIGLVPNNIRYGVSIGGVVGSYKQTLTTQEFTVNGEYNPPEGTDGFSKVIVNVADIALPIEIHTEDEMNSLLTTGDVGAIYKYVGDTTDNYEHNKMYIIEVE